jgi:hypothetical protein
MIFPMSGDDDDDGTVDTVYFVVRVVVNDDVTAL